MMMISMIPPMNSYGFGTKHMFSSEVKWMRQRPAPISQDPSIPSYHTVDQKPIGDCEVLLPLTFDEVACLLLTWPREGERPRFMSWHDSNTNIRCGHRASLSEGERAERRMDAGGLRATGGSGDKA